MTQFGQKANEAAVKAAEEAIKAVILINGGSSVAMLAFLGTLATKDVVSTVQLSQMSAPLLYFGTGVAAAVVAAAAAYFTNLMIAGSSTRQTRTYEQPYFQDTKSSNGHRLAGEIFRYIGIGAMVVSIGCFVTGLVKAEGAFQALAATKDSKTANAPKP
ncbi:hypothetical protein XF30_20995 [Bradyrhizobium sp. SUTN9-2]|nr:hypothetical protein XF30_20995 [Bradyrhizobium sp. SUTN9-2]